MWNNAVHTLRRIAYDRGFTVNHGPYKRECGDVVYIGATVVAVNMCRGHKPPQPGELDGSLHVFAVVDHMKRQRSDFELFDIVSLQHIVVDNDLVPPHRKLASDELVAFDAQYNRSDVAKLFASDPVVRYYNWDAGDVIEITRRDANEYGLRSLHTYRIVAESTKSNGRAPCKRPAVICHGSPSDNDESGSPSGTDWNSCPSESDRDSSNSGSDNEEV